MNKQLEKPIVQALSFFVIALVLAMILWPLFDILMCNFITHGEFKYTVADYIIEPITFSAVMTVVLYVMRYFHKQAAKQVESNKKATKNSKQ